MTRTAKSSDVDTLPRTAYAGRPSSKRSLSASSSAAAGTTVASNVASSSTAQSKLLSRISNKLVLRGSVSEAGATYTLYLRVVLPETAQVDTGGRTATYPLFPDANVRLVSSSIDELTPSGAAPALSVSAARAATFLGLSLGTDGSMSDGPASMPKISTANYCICLVVPPSPTSAKRSYIVTLNMQVGLTAQPPRLPHIVTIPLPRCLNNRMHITLADSACTSEDGVVVEVDPPLVPHSTRRRTGIEEEEDEAGVVTGPFPSAEAVVVRWAAQDAGRTPALPLSAASAATSVRGERLSPVRADALASTLHVSAPLNPPTDLADDEIALGIELHGKLSGAYFAALDAETAFLLTVDAFGQRLRWIDADVTGSQALLRWAPVWGAKSAISLAVSSSSIDSLASTSSSADPVAGIDGTIEEDEEDGALLDVAPPKGMDMADLSYSFDSSLTPQRRRRHSIGSKKHGDTKDEQEQQPVTADSMDAATNGVVLVLNTASVCGLNGKAPQEQFNFTLRGMIVVSSSQPLPGAEGATISLPLFRAPTITTHTCSVHLDTPPPGLAAFELLRSPQAARSPTPSAMLMEDTPLFMLSVAAAALPNRPPPGYGFDAEDCVLVFKPAESQEQDPKVEPITIKQEELEEETVETNDVGAISPIAEADMSTASAVSTATVLMHARPLTTPLTPPTTNLSDGLGGGIVARASLDLWPSVQSETTDILLDAAVPVNALPTRVIHRFDATWPCSLPSSASVDGASQVVGSALGTFVVALPGAKAEVMHASIAGKPVRCEVLQQDGGASCIVELRLPASAREAQEPPRISLMYAVESTGAAEERERAVQLPLVSSTVAAFEVNVHLPQPPTYRVVCPTFQACASSDAGVVRFQTFMLPAMASRSLCLSPAPIMTLRQRLPASLASASPPRSSTTVGDAPLHPLSVLRSTTAWLILLGLALGTLCFVHLSNQLLDVRSEIFRASAAQRGPFGAGDEAPDGWNALPGVYRNVPNGWTCKPAVSGAEGENVGVDGEGRRDRSVVETDAKGTEIALPQQGAPPQEYRPPPKHSALGLIIYSPVFLIRATGRVARRLFTRLFGGK